MSERHVLAWKRYLDKFNKCCLMESWKTFKKKIEKSQVGHKADLYARLIIWKISAPITYLLVRTPITPNQITVFQEIIGAIGAFCLAFKDIKYSLLGVILLQIGYIFDCVDGEVARYKGLSSVRGVYLDLIGHQFVIPMYLFFVGVGVYLRTNHLEAIILSFLSAVFVLRTDLYAMLSVVNTMLGKSENPNYNYKVLLKQFPDFRKVSDTVFKPRKGWKWVIRKKFSYPDSMNLLSIAVIAECIFPCFSIFGYEIVPTYVFVLIFGTVIPLGRILSYIKNFKNYNTEKLFLKIVESAKKVEIKSQDE